MAKYYISRRNRDNIYHEDGYLCHDNSWFVFPEARIRVKYNEYDVPDLYLILKQADLLL